MEVPKTIVFVAAACAGTWAFIAPPGCCTPPAVETANDDFPASKVTSADIARAERARVGALSRIHARGVAEMRTKDETGEHFEQGDIDLRWNPTLGLAASLSKLGDRWAWIGSDTTSWWIFELKSKPSTLRTGPLSAARAGLAPAFPWLMGVHPLVPADGAVPQVIKGDLRVAVAVPLGALPEGAMLEGEFDPKSLTPLRTALTLKDGTVWRSGFNDWMTVETPGLAPGAWPRVPRRVQVVSGLDDRWTKFMVALDTARADPEATDKPGLYDLPGLRTRFAPQQVETEK